uniref:Uncharacterized protein n=1 Tax=Heterorhabditis bacteriophora TaxID=37862 RepID=A0A1I7XNK0_HETBA
MLLTSSDSEVKMGDTEGMVRMEECKNRIYAHDFV